MLLTGQNIKKEYGIQTILDIKKIEMEDGARIGLVENMADIIYEAKDGKIIEKEMEKGY